VSRQRAADLALGGDEIIISRTELDRLHDDLFMLSCAVDDVERDVDARQRASVAEMREALNWLLDAARPLAGREISAPDIPG